MARLSRSHALVIAAGHGAKIPKFRVKRPKVEPPIFRDRSLLYGLDDAVCAKTDRKRQIGPNDLLASTARAFQITYIFAVACSFLNRVVIGALPAPSLD